MQKIKPTGRCECGRYIYDDGPICQRCEHLIEDARMWEYENHIECH